jgi:plasmid maintenance system killer protein
MIYLIKNVSALRATYQVRLLALKAAQHGKKLVLKVPPACRFENSLADLARAMPQVIQREDLP